jgi:hypothetical protein
MKFSGMYNFIGIKDAMGLLKVKPKKIDIPYV